MTVIVGCLQERLRFRRDDVPVVDLAGLPDWSEHQLSTELQRDVSGLG